MSVGVSPRESLEGSGEAGRQGVVGEGVEGGVGGGEGAAAEVRPGVPAAAVPTRAVPTVPRLRARCKDTKKQAYFFGCVVLYSYQCQLWGIAGPKLKHRGAACSFGWTQAVGQLALIVSAFSTKDFALSSSERHSGTPHPYPAKVPPSVFAPTK